MQIFWKYVDSGSWNVIMNGPFILMHVINNMNEEEDLYLWTVDKTGKAQYDIKARNIIAFTLTLGEFYMTSICKTTKDMW